MKKTNKDSGLGIFIVCALIIIILFAALLRGSAQDKTHYNYSDIIGYFDKYEVYDYSLDLASGKLTIKIDGTDNPIEYAVPSVDRFLLDVDTREYRQAYNELHPDKPLVQEFYRTIDLGAWLIAIIPSAILIIVMVVIFIVMMRQTGGGKAANFGRANIKAQSGKKVLFKDVAGADEEKAELEEIVDYLKAPRKFTEIGARIPKGVLLLGPPGTGKTLLAKAVSGEAGVPFFSISGSDFVEMYVGVGASRVRDLFETAKKNAPSIIFIDEIDAVGRHRGAGLGGGHDEREQTLNQLLVEMDGFAGNENVIVMAATNRRDILDPALLRPGRFDRQIVVGYPDIKGREEILKIHSRNKPLAPDVDLNVIAKTTQGFTGADLENLLNESALLAARQNKKAISEKDIEEATIKVIAGPEKKSHIITDRDRKITAVHEAGHAIAAYYLQTQEKVHQVTVIQRGMAAGLTITRPENDNQHVSRTFMREKVVMLLGGRVAEEVALDDICTGASNDIERATKTAHDMVTKYGFSKKIGTVVYGSDNDEVFIGRDYGHTKSFSDKVAAEIDEEVRSIIDNAYEECRKLIEEHRDKLDLVAKYLIEFEKVDGDDFEKIMKGEISPEEIDRRIEETKNKSEKNGDGDIGKILDVTVSDDKPEIGGK